MKKRSTGQLTLIIVLFAILAVGLVIGIVSLAAFRYSKEQTEDLIISEIARQTEQSADSMTITIIAQKDQNNIHAVLLQFDTFDEVQSVFAVFTKLPLIPLYRFDGLFIKTPNYEFARVIQTGFTEELVNTAGSEITVTNSGLGTIPRILGLLVLTLFVRAIALKVYEYDKNAKKMTEQEHTSDVNK